MFSVVAGTLFLCLVPGWANGQRSVQTSWAPEELPHPGSNPEACKVMLREGESGYICDPNGLLGKHVGRINWILNYAAINDTPCPCSNYYCENKPTRDIGYKISVALVKRMKLQSSTNDQTVSPSSQAQIFAHTLETDRWTRGSCKEDIVIFFSEYEKILVIHAGEVASLRLTPRYRQLLAYKVAPRFKKGEYVEALNTLLRDMKIVLNCDLDRPEACSLNELTSKGNSLTASLTLALSIVFVTLWNTFSGN